MPDKDLQKTDCVGCNLYNKLEERVSKCEDEITKINVAYAKIETKLNLIIGILAAIGTALAGTLVAYVFVG